MLIAVQEVTREAGRRLVGGLINGDTSSGFFPGKIFTGHWQRTKVKPSLPPSCLHTPTSTQNWNAVCGGSFQSVFKEWVVSLYVFISVSEFHKQTFSVSVPQSSTARKRLKAHQWVRLLQSGFFIMRDISVVVYLWTSRQTTNSNHFPYIWRIVPVRLRHLVPFTAPPVCCATNNNFLTLHVVLTN